MKTEITLLAALLLPFSLFAQPAFDITDDSEWTGATLTELTIATGAVTMTGDNVWYDIDTEADAASDDLATINLASAANLIDNYLIVLTAENSARDVTIKNGTGNINLNGNADVTLGDALDDWIILHYAAAAWHEVLRSESLGAATATGYFAAGTIEHERGGLEADVSAYDGIFATTSGATYELNTETELEGAITDVTNFITAAEIDTQLEAKGIRTDLVAASVAGDTDAQGNGAQTAENIYITSGAANTCVTVPSLYVGAYFMVHNETATDKKVYPATGDNIGNGLNTAITVGPDEILTIKAKDATNANAYLAVNKVYSETFTILEPDTVQGVSDDIRLKKFNAESYPDGVTITAIHIDASAAYTSETFLFEHWDDASGTTQATVESIACTAISTEDDGTLTDATIPADYFLMVNLDDTPENVAYVAITISYTID